MVEHGRETCPASCTIPYIWATDLDASHTDPSEASPVAVKGSRPDKSADPHITQMARRHEERLSKYQHYLVTK